MGKIADESLVMLELGLGAITPTDEERGIVQQALLKAEGAVMRFLQYDPVQKSHTEFYPQMDTMSGQSPAIWEASDTHAFQRRQSGAASDELQLLNIPVRATPAIQVYVDYDGRFGAVVGSFAAATLQVEGADFWPQYDALDSDGNGICRDGILRSYGRWPSNPGSVKVVYTAGYSDAELNGQDDVIDATPIMEVVVEEALRRAKKVLTLWKENARTGHLAGTITSEGLGEYNYSLNPGVMDKLLSAGGLSSDSKEKLQSFVNYGLYV